MQIKNNKPKFAQIDEDILNADISNSAKILYCHLYLASFFNGKGTSFIIDNSVLEAKMGCCNKTLLTYLNELIEIKCIKRDVNKTEFKGDYFSNRRFTILK